MSSAWRVWLMLMGLMLGVGAVGAAAPSGLLVDLETAEALNCRIQWQTDLALDGRNAAIERVNLIGDSIVVQESANIVSLIQRSDGKVRWRRPVGMDLDRLSAPVLFENQLMIGGGAQLYVLRLDNGELAGTMKLQHLPSTSPVIEGGLVIFGSAGGRVFSHSLSSGLPQWDYQMPSSISTMPARVGGMLVATCVTGTIASLNPIDGRAMWRRAQPPWGNISAAPTGGGEAVYVTCEDQTLYALRATNGEILWQYMTEAPLTDSPMVLGDDVLLPTRDQGLVCLNAGDGTIRWRSSEAMGVPIQQYGGKLVLQAGNRITTVELKSGKVLNTVELSQAEIIVSPMLEGPAELIIARYDGRILKLSPK